MHYKINNMLSVEYRWKTLSISRLYGNGPSGPNNVVVPLTIKRLSAKWENLTNP